MMEMKKQRVLFVCKHNSARSQMAEAFLNAIHGDRFEAYSAGMEPGEINPLAVKVMEEVGLDISQKRTKSVFEILKKSEYFAYVITVCDQQTSERCPLFPGLAKRLHWNFPDPAALSGTLQEKMDAIRKIRNDISDVVRSWGASESTV
jgi:arsenate reductase